MTQEEKAKAYDEALALMEDCIPDKDGYVCVRPCDIFQELKESEDERIRKELIEYCTKGSCGVRDIMVTCNDFQRWAAWLEKQGQVKESDIPQHEKQTCKENSNSLTGCKLPIKWTQDNIDDLTEFEAEMMHVGESFFGEYAGLNPNDTMSVRVQANLLLELANKFKWTEEDEKVFNNLIGSLIRISHRTFTDCTSPNYTFFTEIEWLKELKQRTGQ